MADADLRASIVHRLRRKEPTVDFLAAREAIPPSLPDPEVLTLAADLSRVLVSHDFDTMPGHFYRFLETRESPGLILIPQTWPTGMAIEELRVIWVCHEANELRNRIVYAEV